MAFVGLDIDETGKPMAIAAVTLRRQNDARRRGLYFHVWALEGLSASPYDEAVRRVVKIVDEVTDEDGGYQPTLYGNVTATGRAVLAALASRGVRAQMKPVYLTPGDQQPEEGDGVTLGEGWLVYRLQERLQQGLLRLPDNAGAKELTQELLDYRHPDDSLGSLMTALGLAVYKDPSCIVGIRLL